MIRGLSDIGARIDSRAQEIRMPLPKLAEIAFIPKASFYRKMKGKGEFGAHELFNICLALGVAPNWLLGWKE